MTRDLLSPLGLARFADDMRGQGPEGLDAAARTEEPFALLVICDGGIHLVEDGKPCQRCHPNTKSPETGEEE